MTTFNELIDNLHEIHQAQLEMVGLAKRKKQVLVNGEIEELQRIMKVESNWVKKFSKLEDERALVLQRYVQAKGINQSVGTMSELLDMIHSPQETKQIKEMQDTLHHVHEEIQSLNELNTQLIQQSLDFISHSFSLIAEDSKQSTTYSKPTVKQNKYSSKGFFDKKA